MNEKRWCCFHPKEMVVGICALCLNERLLILASNQLHVQQNLTPKRALPKIFALTSLLTRFDIKQHNSQLYDTSSTCSQEESFISMKFEDNGVALWEKAGKMTSDDELSSNKIMKTVIEHAKPRTALRWRRRIGHLFQLIKWKKSSKGNVCHVGTKLEGAKVKYGWIRSLTKRRTKE